MPLALALNIPVQLSPRAPIECLLADLWQRQKDLEGQLGELQEEIGERRALHRPIGKRRLEKLDRLLLTLDTVKEQSERLQARQPNWLPPGVSAPGDF